MLKRTHYVVFAILGSLILTGATQKHHNRGTKAGNRTEVYHPVLAAAIIALPDSFASEKAAELQCTNVDKKIEDCARASAQATIDQANYSFWQTIGGFLGVLVGVCTLGAAIWAGRWAKHAAQAAIDTLSHARVVSAAELRPWLTFQNTEIDPVRDLRGPTPSGKTSFLIRMVFINKGASPADRVRIYFDHKVVPYQAETPFFGVKVGDEAAVAVGPEIRLLTVRRSLDNSEVLSLEEGRTELWMHASIIYHDFFDKKIEYTNKTTLRARFEGRSRDARGDVVPVFEIIADGPENTLT